MYSRQVSLSKRIKGSQQVTNTANTTFLTARNFLIENRLNYSKAYQQFQWPRLSRFNWALDYFDPMAAGNHQPSLWIVDEKKETQYSFNAISQRSNQVANFFKRLGIEPFDRIMLMLPNTVELWESMLAAIKIPAIIIPTATGLSKEDIAYRLKEASIKYVIAPSAETAKFDLSSGNYKGIVVGDETAGWTAYAASEHCSESFSPLVQTNATDPLLYYFTSGTTSNPKLVIHTHQSYPVGHLSTMYWLGLQPNTVHMNIATPGWAKHPWSAFFAPWNAESCVFAYGYPHFDPDQLLKTLTQYPVTSLCAPPTVWRLLRQKNLVDYRTSLQEIMSAGEPLNPEVSADIKKAWGLPIREGYGQTETTALIGYCPGQTVIPGTMGYPLPGYELALAGGKNVSEGELIINRQSNPVGLMHGYHQQDKTQQVMSGNVYHTGDVLSELPQGFFFIGRKDDVFKSSGYRISPFELESKLLEHPTIVEAAVVPSPHATKGTVPKAFVVLKKECEPTNALTEEIFAFLQRKLAASHQIKRIEYCDQLPKTSSGKILRRVLKEQEALAYSASQASELTF